MTELTNVRGFEDFWRVLREPTRITPALLRDPGFRAALRRVVAGAPPAVLAHASTIHSLSALKANLDYISRKGELILEGRDGEKIVGREEARERAEDWRRDRHGVQERLCLAYAWITSAPPGSPYEPVFEAASAFCRETLGPRTDFMLARHDDEPHPHCHVTIRAQMDDGVQWKPSTRDVVELRGRFAACLRERGVEVDASPRWARGVATRTASRPVRWLQHDHMVGRAVEPAFVQRDIDEAFAIARGARADDRPWEERIRGTRKSVAIGYRSIADGLDALGDKGDLALAKDVRCFIDGMEPPSTRREQRVEAARLLEAERSVYSRNAARRDRIR
ncbi:hypothetical protein ABOZ73_15810 [Caulobacter sp. 73W]|uniref:MobA/VirD2-like nuclease domain-containing protein n=1 Tax=Caulobacter sp. 73W TaxID=3161137 RepID=A0AB39KQU9_9CAUL